ncbi:PaaI family thioesterase [Methanobrevibacter sp. TMH8]|uniref:PaaI family thioesterase n=1 Tax=Methanobrevibacter sp. TMH8 TaxID=2848611 RepID=UPI001CC99937|nr:PaaI family thioesterase [Methanobrevibacter sp. TMH8]MBZ9571421.1 PaaI family thioesterase [Methanobrevibacter sp. TMH8]
MKLDLDRVKKFFINDNFAKSAGIKIESINEDFVECKMEIEDIHRNAVGGVHGGAIFTLADFTFAIHSNLDNLHGADVGNTVGQSCNISYLKSTKGNWLIAKSKCINKGRNISVYQVNITDDQNNVIAIMIGNGFTIAKK